ncbi:hypothetical protein Scep_028097 [Stephania cephalantha]|uniref:Uncharacterized protein n=1 Tax=Stephania cephalantha TaxID=152367 RepID=A0AAP0EBH1_9MAGN
MVPREPKSQQLGGRSSHPLVGASRRQGQSGSRIQLSTERYGAQLLVLSPPGWPRTPSQP